MFRKETRRDRKIASAWLLETGFLLSSLLFAGCMAYMTCTTFFARDALYLSPLSVMELAFTGLSLLFVVEKLAAFAKKKGIRRKKQPV
jgi:hypothetical protein